MNLPKDEHLAGGNAQGRCHEHHQGDPGDVGAEAPGLGKAGPAVEDTAAVSHVTLGEDEELGQAEEKREGPGHQHWPVPASSASMAVCQHGAADGAVAVQRHGQDHVGGGIHAHHLQVLDSPAQGIGPTEAVGGVPGQLGQHLEQSHGQVGQAQVADEDVHGRPAAPPAPPH